MTASTIKIFNDIIAQNTRFWLSVILSLLLVYTLIRKFNKLTRNKASRAENYELAKKWIWYSVLMIKSVFGDSAAMFNLIQKYCLQFEDKPTDLIIGFFHVVYIGKPDDLEVVLNNSNALQKASVYKFFKKYLGQGLVGSSVEKWKRKRRLAAPFFTAKFVDKKYKAFNSYTSDFVEKIRVYSDTNEYFNPTESVSQLTVSLIWDIALGTDLEITEEEKKIITTGAEKFSELSGLRIYRPWLYPDFMFEWYIYLTGWSKTFESLDYFIEKAYYEKKRKLQEKLEYIKEHGEDSITLSYADHVLRLNEAEKEFTDEELMQEACTVIAAGNETSARAICFTLEMLAMNTEIQEKLYREIIKCCGEDDEDLSSQQINDMTYLDQCVKETMRLFPPVPFVMRKATNSFQLNDECTIQKYSEIIIPILMVHRNPEIYPNPLQWNPENFAPDRVESRHKYSFLAFSGGPRGCIGNKYAMTVIKITLAKFLRAYRVETDLSMDDIKINLEFFLGSANGYRIKTYSRIKP